MKIVEWIGGNAPSRDATLTIDDSNSAFVLAYWEPGYCGCGYCGAITGIGHTEAEAIADYWEQWEDRQ